jgi:predicted membrane protein
MDNNDINTEHHGPSKGKVLAGVLLLVIGASLLLKQFDIFTPVSWLFSWPMWLIVWGIYTGGKHNFRNNSSWIFMVLIGGYFLLDRAIPSFDAGAFFWPAMLIAAGVFFILRRNNHTHDYWDKKEWKRKWDAGKYNFNNPNAVNPKEPIVDYTVGGTEGEESASASQQGTKYTGDEHLDALSVFGSVKKTIYSKNFQGGEIVNIFGGAELDLTQADINGRVYIDITQVFGGVKMVVPSHWTIVSDIASVFAGFDDKRVRTTAPLDNTKILVLKGVSIFAGVDIRSY